MEGWGEEKFVRDLKHSTKPFTGQASNNNLRWRGRKLGLSNIPLQNNACTADYNWRAKKTTASKTEGFQSVKLDISLPLLCSCAYIAFNMVDFKTHHASLPWTFALQARSEHYSQACHLWLPQTPWTRCNCWDWEVFDVTPPHHVTMRPICYSESSTEKQNTSIRRIFLNNVPSLYRKNCFPTNICSSIVEGTSKMTTMIHTKTQEVKRNVFGTLGDRLQRTQEGLSPQVPLCL